jgi:hypothetical protein
MFKDDGLLHSLRCGPINRFIRCFLESHNQSVSYLVQNRVLYIFRKWIDLLAILLFDQLYLQWLYWILIQVR